MTLVPLATRHAPNGMVCAVDHLAAEAGVALLRAGGTAADAAVGTSAVLAVTTQHMCGMGGDLFALVHDGTGASAPNRAVASAPNGAVVEAINASGRAGSGADPARLRAEGRRSMPFFDDVRSVPVPGCVDGWVALHARHGRLPLAEVLEPARRYAESGFCASPTLAAAAPSLGAGAAVADLGTAVDGGPLRAGALVRRPGIARALADVAAGGRDAFYGGEFGRGLLALGAGEYDEADLARPLADWVEPLSLDAFGHGLWTVPPNSQGYLTLAAAWIADGLPLPEDPDDPSWAHLLVEAARQAGFDRPGVLHDGADGRALVAPERLGPRRDAIDPERASVLGGAFAGGGTIHLCAIDAERRGVSLIQSNAAGFGSRLVVPGVGICLQNRGAGFSLEPGHPAEYGPGRRPPHTLSPALVTRPDGTLRTVVGTMGGDAQPQVLLQLLARLLHAGQGPADAVAAGRWVLAGPPGGTGFDTWTEGGRVRVLVEGHAPPAWADGLAARGHAVERAPAFHHAFGHAHAITNEGDAVAGASDPRPLVGAAAGW